MEERPPINLVQAGALSKAFFVGEDLQGPADDPEFYWRNYVVDGSASQSLVSVGSWSGVDRIRWEISEDLLIARKAYQIAEGENDKAQPEKTPDGTVVAAFAIKSHFDIRRAYNPTTGEELNVIEENSRDRAWHQRMHMRVDWATNLVDTPMWDDLFIGKLFGNITVTAATYDISDPSHPDYPHFDFEDGYFDITTRYYVKPRESGIWPGVPTCVLVGIFTGSTTYECDDQEATVRSSFVKVDPERQFEPLEMTKAPLDIVGNPGGLRIGSHWIGLQAGIRQGYDPGYGFTDELYHRYAHIHNLWKRSHQKGMTCDANDDLDLNGTADQCENAATGYEGAAGSQCDVASSLCTIPYRDREIRTTGYWVNPEMPAELQDPVDEDGARLGQGAAEQMIHAWDQLLRGALARAREVECRRTGGDRDSCNAEFFAAEKEMLVYGGWLVDKATNETPVLTLCHNPVREYDNHDVCGETNEKARLGDIRKNFFAYWPGHSRAQYGGIGNWGADPVTGEIRGAAAMVMGNATTRAAALQRDIIQVALGDMTIEEITNGVPATNYAHQLQNGHLPGALSAQELERRVASIDAEHAVSTVGPVPIHGASIAEQAESFFAMQKQSSVSTDALESSQLELEAYASALHGTPWEAQLVDSHWVAGATSMSPEMSSDEALLEALSPLRGMDPGGMRALQSDIQTLLGARGMCFHDTEAPVFGSVDLQGLARYFRERYPDGEYDAISRGEAIYRDLWVEAFKGIAIHEIGHSLGLLHNFASSWDTPNYHPGYWQLRTQEGAATASCNGTPRTGDTTSAAQDNCMGPRYLDPATDDEQGLLHESRPGIDYFAATSVMEYSNERFGETIGLGQYDAHAMKALYGRVLETFEDETRGGLSREEQRRFAPRMESQLGDADVVVRDTPPFSNEFAKPTHYTELARMMRVFDTSRCREATSEEKAIAGWRLVHGKVCAPAPRDHAAWGDFEDGLTREDVDFSQAPAWRTREAATTGGHLVRWFYRWGQVSNSYFHINPSDAGADAYELTANTIRKFDAMYPWTYFRRQNREYLYNSIPFAIANGTLERLRAYHWNTANRNAFYRTYGKSAFDIIAASDDWHRPAVVAETDNFGALARILLMPQPGAYGSMIEQPVDSTRAVWDVGGEDFQIGAVDGRFIDERFDSDPEAGGSWDYTHWMIHAGFGVEKTYAAMALADARPMLSTINRENYLDGRGTKINYRTDMPLAMDRLIGGVLSEDWESVAMWVPQGEETPIPRLLELTATDDTGRPESAHVLFPNIGYKQQLGMLVFANVYSRVGSDMQLANKLRLWMLGHDAAIEVPESQQVRFFDPASGYTYVARLYGDDVIDGKTIDRGIASRMLQHANALVAASYEVVVDENGDVVVDAMGTPQLALDADGFAVEKPDGRIGELTRYVGLLDATRQIGHRLGYGPLGGPQSD